MKKYILILLSPLLVYACQHKEPALEVSWELVNNLVNKKGESLWLITLTNNSEHDFPAQGWTLYFNNKISARIDTISGLSIEHINGDLRAVKPTQNFNGIEKGNYFQFSVLSAASIINFTDAPMGFYLVYDQNPDKGIPCTLSLKDIQQNQLKRNAAEVLPTYTPAIAYKENKELIKLHKKDICPIIPTPARFAVQQDSFSIKNEINIRFEKDFEEEARFLKNKLTNIFNGNITFDHSKASTINISFSEKEFANEHYTLDITNKGISIKSRNRSGIFYGIQSLLALAPISSWQSPANNLSFQHIAIEDGPRFAYRGLFLDVARNFHKKDNVLKILDAMAFYKLNTFHFHICDDEGWRVEIDGLPELTEYGAYRGHSANESKYLYPSFGSGAIADASISHGSGYYTRDDFIEIIKYANERHIEVIPEIDMPGHARAAIRSMKIRYNNYMAQGDEQKAKEYLLTDLNDQSQYQSVQGWTDNVIDVCLESSYHFIEKITDEMMAMFDEAGAPLTTIHTGGDEVPHGVWEESPTCKQFLKTQNNFKTKESLAQYFIYRFSELLANRGLTAAGWEEIALLHEKGIAPNPEFIGKNLQPTIWNNMWNAGAEDIGYKLANAGYPIVLAHVTNFYFDLAYNKHPEEPGYYWGNFIDTKRPWEYTPFDITKCAEQDRFGHKIDRQKIKNRTVKLNPKGKDNVLGIQAVLWSENNLGPERMEYFYFPKILGLAERAWAPQPAWASYENDILRKAQKESEWNKFLNTARNDLNRLDYMNGGYAYRVAPPGAIIKDGVLYANTRFMNLSIRYTIDGSKPNLESTLYKKPVKIKGKVKLKSFTSNGRSSRTVVLK